MPARAAVTVGKFAIRTKKIGYEKCEKKVELKLRREFNLQVGAGDDGGGFFLFGWGGGGEIYGMDFENAGQSNYMRLTPEFNYFGSCQSSV